MEFRMWESRETKFSVCVVNHVENDGACRASFLVDAPIYGAAELLIVTREDCSVQEWVDDIYSMGASFWRLPF